MMIGSMLAKVLTDRWCKLQVFFWTNIALAIFSCAFYFFDPHATMMIMVLYFLLNILHQIPSPLHWSLMLTSMITASGKPANASPGSASPVIFSS